MSRAARLLRLSFAWLTLAHASTALGYDYLEHSYFADRACRLAQDRLADRIARGAADDTAVAHYLALAITCPNAWDRPYCAKGYKQLEANLNRLKGPPAQSHQLAITLGDFAALPDHISSFGPVRGMPKPAAQQNGLLARVFDWMSARPESAGGIIGDVSEDACETKKVPWARVEEDIQAFMSTEERLGNMPDVPSRFYAPLARAPVLKGATDPVAAYSFDNPHFLDLVLRDTDHFGVFAYTAWLGFHSTALDISQRTCEEVIGFDEGALKRLARGLPGLGSGWSGLKPGAQRTRGCQVMKARVRQRLIEWSERADPKLVGPVKERLAGLVGGSGAEADARLDRVVTSVMGLVFEGIGLHYLQDGLAAGHMRSVQSRRGLIERRYDHDLDNQNGVVALLNSATGEHPFVAFGDTYLLAPTLPGNSQCDWDALKMGSPAREQVSDCLIQHQRGILVATAASSLLDWSLSGFMFGADGSDPAPCEHADVDQRFLCWNLPLQATHVPGQEEAGAAHKARLHHGVLPIPPPPFHYESLAINTATDLAGSGSQVGLDATLYSELGPSAGWLTSYRMGIRANLDAGQSADYLADFSFGFHWRWAARFLVDMEPFVFAGIRGVESERAFVGGLGPRLGITALPEGWVKIPLELSISYRLPMTLVTSDYGFSRQSFRIDGHWLQISLGLAFM